MNLIYNWIVLYCLGIITGSVITFLWLRSIYRKPEKRKKSEVDLYNREDQLSIFLNTLSDFIYIKDRESRFVIANKKNASVLGLKSTSDLVGKTDLDFYPDDMAKKYFRDEQKIVENGLPLLNEVEMGLNEAGVRSYISTSKFPIFNSEKKVIGIVGVGRDVTKLIDYEDRLVKYNEELKNINRELVENQERISEQSEELMVQSDELKRANEQLIELVYTRDKFFSIIAHDLKNPVNLLRGYSELLIDRYAKINDEKKQNYIRLINGATIQLINLLENLLQWSRMQTGGITFQPQKIRISSLLDENICLFTEQCRNKSINFICHPVDESLLVFCDKNMIDFVLRNLLANAIKYTRREGNISISCKETPEEIQISVSDDGIGIEDSLQKELFLLVRNTSRVGTEGETGTGLGLVLCRDFITKNKGKIWCESEPAKGSVFSFSLPRATE
jgi:PAS domain S-box-containing protein